MPGYSETLDANAKMRKAPKNVLHSIELKKADNGGVVASHRMSEFNGKEPVHAFGADEGAKLGAHIEQHLGIKMGESHSGKSMEEEEAEKD